MRPRQHPPVSQSQIPHPSILRSARNRIPTPRPHLHLVPAILRPLLRPPCRRHHKHRDGRENHPSDPVSAHDLSTRTHDTGSPPTPANPHHPPFQTQITSGSSVRKPCHPERSEAPTERSRGTPCFFDTTTGSKRNSHHECHNLRMATAPIAPPETLRAVHRIQAITIAWMILEAILSLYSAWSAHSPALAAFGGDSAVELVSALVVLWRFRNPAAESAERIAARLTATLLFVVAAF